MAARSAAAQLFGLNGLLLFQNEAWPGRAGDYSPALPQIRTCPFGASGSSSQGLTFRLATHGGGVDSGLRVLAPAECLRRGSPTRHLPSLPRILAVRVSRVRGYYEGVRLPASLSPRSLPPLGDTTVALARSLPTLASRQRWAWSW